MYEGPIVYQSQVYDYFLIGCVVFAIITVMALFVACLFNIFKKAEKNPWTAFIPIYNFVVLLEVAALPSYYTILLFIPVIGIFPMIRIAQELTRSFRRKKSFAWGLFFLPIVYYPILAFSQDRYIGINEEKVESIVLEEILEPQQGPVIEESSNLIPVENTQMVGNTPIIGNTQTTENISQKSLFNDRLEKKIEEPLKKSNTPQYKECPDCHNKVISDAATCFICGHKF